MSWTVTITPRTVASFLLDLGGVLFWTAFIYGLVKSRLKRMKGGK